MPQPSVKRYDFGVIVINGDEYRRDVIITPNRVIGNWWRREGHYMVLEDILEYIDPDTIDYDVVVIGTGYYGAMKVDEKVIQYFKEKGREVIVKPSPEAVETYNGLIEKGRKVLAFFHLTC